MSLQDSLEKRLKQRQDELKSQKEMLEHLQSNQAKIVQNMKNVQDMIHLISGAIHELTETLKSLKEDVSEEKA